VAASVKLTYGDFFLCSGGVEYYSSHADVLGLSRVWWLLLALKREEGKFEHSAAENISDSCSTLSLGREALDGFQTSHTAVSSPETLVSQSLISPSLWQDLIVI
jgi:hypothetical protein